ncbi:MAG: sugar ABC transporter ATP-binding protein [Synergistaceae bacterium]|jgi:simple sugar transport system ATP-binding protein|nr:sugar ABC transporter ATP-binding protein [Synergistaceae bacterium]
MEVPYHNVPKDDVLPKTSNVLLEVFDIEKTFPGVRALKRVNFALSEGEVHSLMGENGAGKSTLIKCLTGVYGFDGGRIVFQGREIRPESPLRAISMGISSVYQEVNLCPNLSVAENIFAGRQPMKGFFIDWKTLEERAAAVLARFDLDIDVRRSLDSYSIAIQQMIAIARALDISSRVLILDEPTSSLDKQEVEKLFEIIRRLRGEGIGIIFITHFLDQVYEISDRITVLRNGELVGTYKTEDLPKIDLVTKMVGKNFEDLAKVSRVRSASPGDVILALEEVSAYQSVENVSLELKRGEVLGFAGLLGSGRTETANLMFGIDRNSGGVVRLKGTAVKLASPREAIRGRIAFCPEDRKRDGIVGELSVRENIILALQARRGVFRFIPLRKQYELASRYIELLGIATPDADKKVNDLSGGNQPKVILARWLATEPEVMLLDEPTRGIDIGAKAEIMKLTLGLCQDGMAIAFISSELDEIVRISDRVIVMRDRAKIGEIEGDGLNQDNILRAIAGGGAK